MRPTGTRAWRKAGRHGRGEAYRAPDRAQRRAIESAQVMRELTRAGTNLAMLARAGRDS